MHTARRNAHPSICSMRSRKRGTAEKVPTIAPPSKRIARPHPERGDIQVTGRSRGTAARCCLHNFRASACLVTNVMTLTPSLGRVEERGAMSNLPPKTNSKLNNRLAASLYNTIATPASALFFSTLKVDPRRAHEAIEIVAILGDRKSGRPFADHPLACPNVVRSTRTALKASFPTLAEGDLKQHCAMTQYG